MNTRRSITEFLALRRNTVLLLVALMLAGTGERLWLGCIVLARLARRSNDEQRGVSAALRSE